MIIIFPFIIFALAGLAFGSFGDVWVRRMARGEGLAGRSRCESCKKIIAWWDLIPVLSYVLLRGKCRHCKARIAAEHFLLEVASGLLFVLVFVYSPDVLSAIANAAVLYGLLLITTYDLKFQMIPDAFTAVVFCGALAATLLSGQLLSGLTGTLIALGFFGVQWIISRGKFVGSGDIILSMSLGLWLGWAGTITMVAASYIIGAVVALVLLSKGAKHLAGRIAFGPFLALGALLAFLGVGEAYVSLIR